MPIRMATNDDSAEIYRMLATVGFSHQAFREIERLPQRPNPTYFLIWTMPLIADGGVDHGGPVFSKLRRSGW
jgi:hypothetical protein